MTARLYSHALPSDDRRAADAWDETERKRLSERTGVGTAWDVILARQSGAYTMENNEFRGDSW